MARGNNKMQLFHDSQDFRFYRKLWRKAKEKFGLKILRWCLMPNHIHFIVLQLTQNGLSEAMHYIQQRYAKYYGRRYKWVGHVWQGRYTSRLIADDAYLFQCGQYVENNPVRAGLVARPEDYLWSSAYARARGFDDGLVDKISAFDSGYGPRESMGVKLDFPETKVGVLKNGRRVLGSADSIQALATRFGDMALKKHGRPPNK
jgi:putative transposase